MDQGIHSPESYASSNLLRCIQLISTYSVESLSFTRIYRDYRVFRTLSMEIVSIGSTALAAPNLKDRSTTTFAFARGLWWAILPKRRNSPRRAMDCSLWKVFPSLPAPCAFREMSGMGSVTARRTTALRLIPLAGDSIPYREASLLTSCNASNFSKVHRK